ncbi:MAG: glycosyltransferase family 2 protein [Bacteroidetes bacterium]|nr:MAG: glycosyltransferase family 2 protein [Bacteroidota bacterium]
MKITFVLITKNSEKIINKLLDSVKNICDEIIIVDNGSTDNTVKIVRSYTDKVYISLISGQHFLSKLRNLGKDKATGDWILCLDSDEILSEEANKLIPFVISSDVYDGYWLRRRNYVGKNVYLKHGYFYPDFQLSLFKNRLGYKYTKELHTRIGIPENKTKKLDVDIFHYSQYPKYQSLNNLINFKEYIVSDANDLIRKKYSSIEFFLFGIYYFFSYFINGFIRGKGFLDGYRGFIANFNFSFYISSGYLLAAYLKLIKKVNSI